jgi:hypothetical protein
MGQEDEQKIQGWVEKELRAVISLTRDPDLIRDQIRQRAIRNQLCTGTTGRLLGTLLCLDSTEKLSEEHTEACARWKLAKLVSF